jgi:hypothetical protein
MSAWSWVSDEVAGPIVQTIFVWRSISTLGLDPW